MMRWIVCSTTAALLTYGLGGGGNVADAESALQGGSGAATDAAATITLTREELQEFRRLVWIGRDDAMRAAAEAP